MIVLDAVVVPDQTDVEMWNAILGFVSATFILPLIQQPSWPTKVRSAVTFLWSLIGGFVITWVAGDITTVNVVHSVALTFIAAIASYHGFAQPTQIAQAIENATSPGSARKQPTDDPPAEG